ncbi:DNA polymerase III subunit beta [Siculibacillus lacustris]|uniref:Beta sliding clamp n=1 Tax=Siculibacillus lacustris TaxID=1549641 RepID=A0A4Q9VS54_9HYPH|nr:DNA polymerase III subunit beta [Siculibacillus lacustris]TBW38801.1 DNA polymerase III subunit beta [Siculibacillus lacustris]
MKLTVARRDLHPALAAVSRIVEARNTVPILSNVALEATGERLTIHGTDLDIEARARIEASIDSPGALTISAARFKDIVGKLGDGPIRIESDESAGLLKISAARSKFSLATLPIADFPDLTTGELPHHFGLAGDLLAAAFEACTFAISTEETRYYLNGVYVHAAEGRLVFVSTDGHRLSKWTTEAPEGCDGMPGVIVPRKTVAEIARLAKGNPNRVAIALSDSKIQVTLGDTVLVSKLIDGTFPDYGRVIPRDYPSAVEIDRSAFSAAADRVLTISSERGRAIRCDVDPGRPEMILDVANPDAGTATETVSLGDTVGDTPVVVGVNGRYLVDALASIGGDAVRVAFADAGSPILLTPTDDPAGLRRTIVIMPMRV